MGDLDLPKGWVITTLGDTTEWGAGGTPARSNAAFFCGVIPWIKTGELGPKFLYDSEEKITIDAVKSSSAKVFPKDSIAVAMYGATIGKVSIFGVDASTNQACAVAAPSQAARRDFLYYFLLGERRAFIKAGQGGAQPNISQGVIKGWPVALPPLKEQERIVSKLETLLSELDHGVKSLQTAQAQLKVYRQALLKHAFEGRLTASWRAHNASKLLPADQLLARIQQARQARHAERLKAWQAAHVAWEAGGKVGDKPIKPRTPKPIGAISVSELAELPKLPDGWAWVRPDHLAEPDDHAIGIGPFGSNLKVSDYQTEGVPLVFVKNITRSDFRRDLKFVEHAKAAELAAHSVKALDLLITKMGDPPGDCEIYPADSPIAILTADCLKFRLWDEFANRQLYKSCINSNLVRKQFGLITKGVAQKKISVDRFKTICLPLMSVEEQAHIASMLDEKFSVLDQLDQTITTSLQQSEALRQSILKKAFSGQLVPQDPADEPASALLERIRASRAAKALKPAKTAKPRARKAASQA